MFEVLQPSIVMLPSYQSALRRGWSPDNLTDQSASELAASATDPTTFIAKKSDVANADVAGRDISLPDGTSVPRLPMRDRWIWDGEFCGRIGLRYRPGTNDLPPQTLGHIGYAVVPWKRQRGLATRALAAILGEARAVGLTRVSLTCDADNIASQKVILGCGGRLAERFVAANYGGSEKLRYTIDLV